MKKRIVVLLTVCALIAGAMAGCTEKTGGQTPAKDKVDAAEEEISSEEVDASGTTQTETVDVVIDPAQIAKEKLDTTLTVALSLRDKETPYGASLEDGLNLFTAYLDSIGQKYEVKILDAMGSDETQIKNLTDLTQNSENIIAFADSVKAENTAELVQIPEKASVYIGTVGEKPADLALSQAGENWVVHTNPDYVDCGYRTAKALFESMGGKGSVFVIRDKEENKEATGRCEGLQKALKEYPDIEVVEDECAYGDPEEATGWIETWLGDEKEVQGIWCASDVMGNGVIEALDGAGLICEVGVTGYGALPSFVEHIACSEATATISPNGCLQSGYTLAICYAAWAGVLDVKTLPASYREFTTPAMLIDSPDAAEEYQGLTHNYDFSHPFYGKAD